MGSNPTVSAFARPRLLCGLGALCFCPEALGGRRRETPTRFGRTPQGRYCQHRPPSHAPVAQRIEHLTTDQKVEGSNPFGRTQLEEPESRASLPEVPAFSCQDACSEDLNALGTSPDALVLSSKPHTEATTQGPSLGGPSPRQGHLRERPRAPAENGDIGATCAAGPCDVGRTVRLLRTPGDRARVHDVPRLPAPSVTECHRAQSPRYGTGHPPGPGRSPGHPVPPAGRHPHAHRQAGSPAAASTRGAHRRGPRPQSCAARRLEDAMTCAASPAWWNRAPLSLGRRAQRPPAAATRSRSRAGTRSRRWRWRGVPRRRRLAAAGCQSPPG